MKIIIAIDSFKGSIDSLNAGSAVAAGIRRVYPNATVITIPVADGGEGFTSAIVGGLGGGFRRCEVTDPLGNNRTAEYGILPDGTAILEMAQASGLLLVSDGMRNPLVTTSYGTGQLIRAALDEGCKRIILGIGGSATNDSGMGMMQALGVSFRNKNGNELGAGGGQLAFLNRIDVSRLDKRLASCEIITACDVTNPLCGEQGASAVYGPQKGATPEMVQQLDKNLAHFAEIAYTALGKDVAYIPGSGAAGGLGAALLGFCGATLKPGIEVVAELCGLREQLRDADLVITGEGRIDKSTAFGKAPVGIAKLAKEYGIPVVALCGSIGAGAEAVYAHGIDVIVPIVNEPMTLQSAMDKAEQLLTGTAERVMRLWRMDKDG